MSKIFFSLALFLIIIASFEVKGLENQQQWIRVQNDTLCGKCSLDHQCYRPLNFENGPFICYPDQFNINLPLIKAADHYCKVATTQWTLIAYVSGICAIFTILNILLVVFIVRCRICR